MVAGGGMHGIRRDTVNERAVGILLECILGLKMMSLSRPCSQGIFVQFLNLVLHLLNLYY